MEVGERERGGGVRVPVYLRNTTAPPFLYPVFIEGKERVFLLKKNVISCWIFFYEGGGDCMYVCMETEVK